VRTPPTLYPYHFIRITIQSQRIMPRYDGPRVDERDKSKDRKRDKSRDRARDRDRSGRSQRYHQYGDKMLPYISSEDLPLYLDTGFTVERANYPKVN
jgi:hypothetical protein